VPATDIAAWAMAKEGQLSALRKGRVSIAGARYFVTVVTSDRQHGLNRYELWSKFLELAARDAADVWAAVFLPDHLHVFFVLPEDDTVGRVMRSLKGPLTPLMRDAGLRWQKNFFEHRLRSNEMSEPYMRYMFCNPYRAGYLNCDKKWPFWAITSPQAKWFVEKFPKQLPEAEWLSESAPWVREGGSSLDSSESFR